MRRLLAEGALCGTTNVALIRLKGSSRATEVGSGTGGDAPEEEDTDLVRLLFELISFLNKPSEPWASSACSRPCLWSTGSVQGVAGLSKRGTGST